MSNAELERQALTSAYQTQLQALYKTLVTNLVSGENEQTCVARFSAGVNIARRAHELADQACDLH